MNYNLSAAVSFGSFPVKWGNRYQHLSAPIFGGQFVNLHHSGLVGAATGETARTARCVTGTANHAPHNLPVKPMVLFLACPSATLPRTHHQRVRAGFSHYSESNEGGLHGALANCLFSSGWIDRRSVKQESVIKIYNVADVHLGINLLRDFFKHTRFVGMLPLLACWRSASSRLNLAFRKRMKMHPQCKPSPGQQQYKASTKIPAKGFLSGECQVYFCHVPLVVPRTRCRLPLTTSARSLSVSGQKHYAAGAFTIFTVSLLPLELRHAAASLSPRISWRYFDKRQHGSFTDGSETSTATWTLFYSRG